MSVFIDPFGRMAGQTEYDVQAVAIHEIGLNDEMTPYTRYGDVIAVPAFILSIALGVVVIGMTIIRKCSKIQEGGK
jgi:apolipoprotein N-acyltransferase